MPNAIEIKSVSKTYKQKKIETKALTNISLNIPRGSFFGLIGQNGAGKTTLIKLIIGLSKQDSGAIKVAGCDTLSQYYLTRKMIGVSTQEYSFDPYLTVKEELELTGGYFAVPRIIAKERTAKLLAVLGLADKSNTFTDKLSGGMKRRLSIAKALIHEPEILILDEPTSGLDIQLRHELWEILKQLNKEGKTILLTTHYLEETEHLCDKIAIISKGEIKHIEDNQKKHIRKDSHIEKLFMEIAENAD